MYLYIFFHIILLLTRLNKCLSSYDEFKWDDRLNVFTSVHQRRALFHNALPLPLFHNNSHLSLLLFSPGLKTQRLPAEAVQGQFILGLWQGTVVLSERGGGAPSAQLKYRLLVSLQANGNQLWGRFSFSGSRHSPREETLTLSQPRSTVPVQQD